MLLICVRDCYGTPQTGLMVKGREYDVNLTDPWIIHFEAPPGSSPENVQAVTEATRNEVARGKRELERRRVAKKKAEEAEDGFGDMTLSVPE